MKYPVYIEKDKDSDYGVTIPDLPGCFSAGATIEQAIENAEEAILTHVEGLLIDCEVIPAPSPMEILKKKAASSKLVWGMVSVDIGKLSKEVKRINITMPEHILSRIDSFAARAGESRSSLLASAALEYLAQHG